MKTDRQKLAEFALAHLHEVQLEKVAIFGLSNTEKFQAAGGGHVPGMRERLFGPSATDRMQAAYSQIPTQVGAGPAAPAPKPAPPKDPLQSVHNYSQATTPEMRAQENLQHVMGKVPGQGGVGGNLSGGNVKNLRAAEDNFHRIAGSMPQAERAAHQAALNSAMDTALKAQRNTRAVAGAAAGATAAAGGVAAVRNHMAQKARTQMAGRVGAGVALGAGALGLGSMLLSKPKPPTQPQQAPVR